MLRMTMAASLLAFAGTSYAGICGSGTVATGILDTADMTINAINATDCHGPFDSGASNLGTMQTYVNNNNLFGGGWTGVVKDDANGGTATGGTFSGIQFALSAGPASTSGSFLLTLTDTNGSAPLNLPTNFDILGVLNGGNVDAAYFFDDILLSNSNNGTYTIAFKNNGGNFPNLSHITILVREGDTPTDVPEPAPLTLFAIGLLGAALARRRNHQGEKQA